VPTVAEEGYPGFESGTWYGLFAPARVPRDIADKISRDTIAAPHAAGVQQKLSSQDFDVIASGPEALAAHLKTELAKWGGQGRRPEAGIIRPAQRRERCVKKFI
jgi:tripartite-type tricarboxylate transporter receptor subunit TctC